MNMKNNTNMTQLSNDTDQLRLSGRNRDNVGDNQTTSNVDKFKTGEPLAASGWLDGFYIRMRQHWKSLERFCFQCGQPSRAGWYKYQSEDQCDECGDKRHSNLKLLERDSVIV